MSFDSEFFNRLLSAAGPSSFEERPAAIWQEQAESYGATLTTDTYGNSFAKFGSGKTHLMLAGHIDEIGLMITYIDTDGFVYFDAIGGWDASQLIGQRVKILGYKQDLLGVIGKKAIHLQKADERRKAVSMENLWIDIGADSYENARQYIREGDVAVIEQPMVELLNGRVVSKAIDNRIGAYIALEAARRIEATANTNVTVTACATVQEEIGHFGALVAAYGLEADVAIALDVTHASDTPNSDKKKTGNVPLGSGASLAIGSVIHRRTFNKLIDAAESASIPYTIEAAPKKTSTDADDIVRARAGTATALISIPNRYMHSPNEMIDLKDVEACIQLIVEFAKNL